MEFSIKIRKRKNGAFEASCPELGLMLSALTIEKVIDEIKDMILLLTSCSQDPSTLEREDYGRLYITQQSDKIH